MISFYLSLVLWCNCYSGMMPAFYVSDINILYEYSDKSYFMDQGYDKIQQAAWVEFYTQGSKVLCNDGELLDKLVIIELNKEIIWRLTFDMTNWRIFFGAREITTSIQ